MTVDRITVLEKEYFDARRNMYFGLYILLAGIILVVLNALGWSYNTQIMQGIVIGVGLVFSGIHYDKYYKTKRELDMICQRRYGKRYFESLPDIINDKYPKSK